MSLKRRMVERCLLEMGELGFGCVPHLDRVGVIADELLQVRGKRAPVGLEAAARGTDALSDVEDDAGEAVLVDVDFLVVGDLAKLAAMEKEKVSGVGVGLEVCARARLRLRT
jgi:hypothetical protein